MKEFQSVLGSKFSFKEVSVGEVSYLSIEGDLGGQKDAPGRGLSNPGRRVDDSWPRGIYIFVIARTNK